MCVGVGGVGGLRGLNKKRKGDAGNWGLVTWVWILIRAW